MRPVFYHGSMKNMIVAFGSLFDDIRYTTTHGDIVQVPISYSPRSKFIEFYTAEPSFDTYDSKFTLPRMGFEVTGLNFAPERFHNPLSRMLTDTDDKKFMFARIPYDFSVNLYLATKNLEDSFKIVEQIVPFFTPELTVTIQDQVDFNLRTDVPIVLNSVGFDIQYEGSFEEKRVIEWTLGFTIKGYMYSDVKSVERIKSTITDIRGNDYDAKFAQLIADVIPKTANKKDPHVVVETKKDQTEGWRNE